MKVGMILSMILANSDWQTVVQQNSIKVMHRRWNSLIQKVWITGLAAVLLLLLCKQLCFSYHSLTLKPIQCNKLVSHGYECKRL